MLFFIGTEFGNISGGVLFMNVTEQVLELLQQGSGPISGEEMARTPEGEPQRCLESGKEAEGRWL